MEKDLIEAEHYCYKRLENPVIIRRKIVVEKLNGVIKIEDTFSGNGSNRIEIFYHFHPQIKIEKLTNQIYQLELNELKLLLELPEIEYYKTDIEEGLYSESYGKIEKNLVLRITIEKKNKFPESFVTLLKSIDS